MKTYVIQLSIKRAYRLPQEVVI